MKLDHIGIAVKDLDESIKFYRDQLGLEVGEPEELKDRKLKICFVKVGDANVELLWPTEPNTPVAKFIEKPRLAVARRVVSSGKFFWNSGIFIFKTSTMLSMFKKHMPSLYRGLLMLPDIKNKKRFNMRLKRLYKKLKSKSLDYGVLEKSKNIRVIPW